MGELDDRTTRGWTTDENRTPLGWLSILAIEVIEALTPTVIRRQYYRIRHSSKGSWREYFTVDEEQ